MAPSESEISTLLKNGAYSADLIPKFEEYVSAQIAGQTPYHADAVRRLMKLYQFYPNTAKPDKIAEGCFLALLQFPAHTDFLALKYMIPSNTLNQETCGLVKACFQDLESCQFAQFWETYAQLESSSTLSSYLTPQTRKTFQAAILQVMALTYKQAPSSVVLPACQVDSVDAIKGHSSVESVSGDTVVFVTTVDNTKRQRVYQESLDFASISALMSQISQ